MKLLQLLLPLSAIYFKDIRAHRVVNTTDFNICNSYGVDGASGHFSNFPCYSFADLLVNLTDNATLYIATDMELFSFIQLTHLGTLQ